MRWYEATVYERVPTGTDATRNTTYRLCVTGRTLLVRTAPRSATHNPTEGNEFDVTERTFVTKAAPGLLEGAAAIEVRGELWDVVGTSRMDSMLAVRVRRAKRWPST